MNSTLSRALVLLAALAQLFVPLIVNPFRDGENPVRSGAGSQIEPAAYAFAIWGPIYLLAAAYAIWQLTRAGREDAATARIAPFAIVLYVGSSVWLYAAQFGPLWATMPILAVMALCACASLLIATRTPVPAGKSAVRTGFVIVPFSLYAGWTLCATFVNFAEVAPRYGFDRFGLSVATFGVLSIAAAAALASVVVWRARTAVYFVATVVWALTAIAVAAVTRQADGSVLIASIAAALALLAIWALRSRVVGSHALAMREPLV